MNLSVLKSDLFVIAVTTPTDTFKLFQIVCRKDGSIFIPFPYYRHSSAQLIERTMAGGQVYPTNISASGPLTMHRVKYTHHVDGEAHFSQDGKILTKVRRRANSLRNYEGHLFTVQLQGLFDFQRAKDRDLRKSDRTLVSLQLSSEPTSLKMVGHLYSTADMRKRLVGAQDSGPWIRTVDGQKERAAVLLAVGGIEVTGGEDKTRILALSFEEVPQVFTNQPSGFCFLGGFDAAQTVFDHSQDTTFLMLMSPAGDDPDEIVRKFGSVDLRSDT